MHLLRREDGGNHFHGIWSLFTAFVMHNPDVGEK